MNLPEINTNSVGKFLLKLKPGESVTGVFKGDPAMFYQHFTGGRSSECPGRNVCQQCASGEKASWRFRLNFIAQDSTGAWSVKVFEQGRRVYTQLVEINKENPLEHTRVKITRIGADKQTTYQIMPSTKAITTAENATIEKLSLHTLATVPAASEDNEEDVA